MKRLIVPAVITLLVVAAFVALAGSNKTSEPLARLTLSESELRLAGPVPDYADDDPGVQLLVQYHTA